MHSSKISMVDLNGQYEKIRPEINYAIQEVIDCSAFINGKNVAEFEENLSRYLGVKHVISCANGTDALQIALMALDLEIGDEIIIPAFTYAATAEVIALLGLKPVMVDVDPDSFNLSFGDLESAITERTRVIIPVHLFGQCSDMESVVKIKNKYNLKVIEDNAQSLGAVCRINGMDKKAGAIGDIGCTSFFPTKNLGCFGDGGALMSNDDTLAQRIRMIANHGQKKKYYHSVIGCNSRLDTIQAAILNVKLNYLDQHLNARREAAKFYTKELDKCNFIQVPIQTEASPHTFNQYTLKVTDGKRDALKTYLSNKGIPSMIYYPLPLYMQEAFRKYVKHNFYLPVTEDLCKSVLSIPIHTEMNTDILSKVTETILSFNEDGQE